MAEFLQEARFRIPNLKGLKFSHDDLVDLQGCVTAEGGAFDVLFGCDEALWRVSASACTVPSAARITSPPAIISA